MTAGENAAITWRAFKDFSTGTPYFVVEQNMGLAIIAWTGIYLLLSAKYIQKIIGNVVLKFILYFNEHWTVPSERQNDNEDPTERTPFLRNTSTEFRLKEVQPIAKLLKETTGVRDLAWEFFANEQNLTWGYRIILGFYQVTVAAASLGLIYGGVTSARTGSIGPAIMASTKCGYWTFDPTFATGDQIRNASLIDLAKEERAAQYAANCYRNSPNLDATQCNFLYRPKLDFDEHGESDCPFLNNTICSGNQFVKFQTQITDAGDLGINSEHTHKFRRTTQCAPLSMEYPFIQNKTENGTVTYYYYYGERSDANYTYKTVGEPWNRLAPIYDVFAYSSENYNEWKPTKELTTKQNYTTVTLIFISSLRIFYRDRSLDPIFPADMEVQLPGDEESAFRNSDPRARPLACVNRIDLCSTDGSHCWAYDSNETGKYENLPEFVFLEAALDRTDIIYSIQKRLGRGLLAQNRVSGYRSETLDRRHWVQEVKNLVEIAHARTQINAWGIGIGENSDLEEWDNWKCATKDYANLCNMFKYNPSNYNTIKEIPFILIWLVTPFMWILSWDWNSVKKLFTKAPNPPEHRTGQSRSGASPQPVADDSTEDNVGDTSTTIPISLRGEPSLDDGGLGAQPTAREWAEGDITAGPSISEATQPRPGSASQSATRRSQEELRVIPSSETSKPEETTLQWEPLLWWGLPSDLVSWVYRRVKARGSGG